MTPTTDQLDQFEKDLTAIVSKSEQQKVFVHENGHILSPNQLRHDIDLIARGLLSLIAAGKQAGASAVNNPDPGFGVSVPGAAANSEQQ